MLIVISPAKTLDYESPPTTSTFTQPDFLDKSAQLIAALRRLSRKKIAGLMDISKPLALLNHDRYHSWQPPFDSDNAKQAVLAFKGDVYLGLDAAAMNQDDLQWAQDHLRILSGLYGLLRPLDLIQPYRLEMRTRLKVRRSPNLYSFWREEITGGLNRQLDSIDSRVLVNLASPEYFKSVAPKVLDARVVTPLFKDRKGDNYKMIGFFAKKARGTMAAWIIKNRLTKVSQLNRYTGDGYQFNRDMSSANELVFTREQAPG
jgi:cytoplasmic iron level regulating protein YaaA (DUF328/UPF0246 family)